MYEKLAIEGGKPASEKYIPLAKPLISQEEIDSVVDTLKSGWLTTGPKTRKFEENLKEYLGAKEVITLNSCTAALHLSLVANNIGPGDEVITSPYTFCSTVNVIEWVGAKPIFVDVEEDTFNIDVSKIEDAITKKTKAIIPVHYAGQSCDMNEIMEMAKKYNLYVFEDAAHAIGAKYNEKMIGTIGDTASFSFYATKNLATGEGGCVSVNNKEMASKIRSLRLHGMDKDAWKRYDKGGKWYYDVKTAGQKCNLTDVQSAIGLGQLNNLDSFNENRIKLAKIYDEVFLKIPEIKTLKVKEGNHCVYHLYPIRIDSEKLSIDRKKFIDALVSENIGTSVHFIPVHTFSYYKNKYKFKPEDFPIAWKNYQEEISLPMFNGMTEKEAEKVILAVKKIVNRFRK